jgi:leucyl aminopeptidase
MTVTLLTSQSAPTTTDADTLVIGVFQGKDGPVPTLGTDEMDVLAALTALGATGKPEELTKVLTAGRLAAPVETEQQQPRPQQIELLFNR